MSSVHAGGIRFLGPLFATAVVALAAGCQAGIRGSAGAPVVAEQPPAEPPPLVVASANVDDDLVYEPQAPVDDIEGYPFVVYGGVNVYFVDGRWYRHDRGRWGYFRNEPPELGRQREMHDHDARWARAPEAPPRTAPEHPGVTERQGSGHAAPPGRAAAPAKAAPVTATKKKPAKKKVAPAHAGPTKEPSERERR
jgi:hypothetical protein